MFKFDRFEFIDKIALFSSFLFVLTGSIVSVLRFWQYEVFYYDFGIFDRAIWLVSRFQAPIVDHLVTSGKWILADHFYPSVFLLSPLYWFTDRQETILVVQSLAVGLSGIVIYFIGVQILKNKFASLSILISYFLFIGLQNAVISDFHEVTVATLPFALAFWAIIEKKLKWFIIFGILTLGFKESLSVIGIAMGIFIILFSKSWLKIGLLTSVFSLIYGLLTIKFLIPYFSGGFYSYAEHIEPTRFVAAFFDNPVKFDTMLKSFWSFSFLPIFSPIFWILILQDFGVRFYSLVGTTRINLGLHYSALLSIIMAISSIYGLKFIASKLTSLQFKFLLIFIILNSLFLYRFITHGPFALAYNPTFYRHTNDFEFLNKMVQKVPANSSVMTQNNLASHFTHQPVYLLRMTYEEFKPDYILIDVRPEQNANNFFGASADFQFEKFIRKVSEDKCYRTIYKTKHQFIFKKSC